MPAITKSTFIDELAAHAEIPKTAAAKFLESFIAVTTDNLTKGNDITFTGFGSFKGGKRAARSGRNPTSGEAIQIAASNTVKFSAGAALKSAMNPK